MLLLPRRASINPPIGLLPSSDFLGQGLVAYYGMNEGGGTKIYDLTGYNHGSYLGSSPGRKPGLMGNSVILNGTDNYIKVPLVARNTFVTAKGFSVVAWIYWVASTEGYNSIYDTSTGSVSHSFLIRSDGQLALYFQAGNVDPVGSSDTVPTGRWTMVGFSYDDSARAKLDIYLNAKRVNSSAAGGFAFGTAGDWLIGGHSVFGSGRWFNGRIGSFGIWSRALTPSDFRQLYQDQSAVFEEYKRIYGVAALPVVPLTEDLSDTITLSDSVSVALSNFVALSVGISDSISLSDSLSDPLLGQLINLSDTISLSDALALVMDLELGINESLTLSDSLNLNDMANLGLDIRDFYVLQDFLQTSSSTYLSLFDTITLSDVIALSLSFTALNLSDSLSLSDSLTLNLAGVIEISLSDTLVLSDAVGFFINESFNSYLRRYLNDLQR